MQTGKKSVILLWARRLVALAILVALCAAFLGLSGTMTKTLVKLAKIQFVPALFAGNITAVIVILAVTALFGRFYCSVICPLGVMQDVAFIFNKRRQLAVRLAALALFVALGALGLGYSWFEPYGLFARGVISTSLEDMPAIPVAIGVGTLHFGILIAIFILALYKGRAWCNWICPVGTVLGLCAKFAPFGLKIDSAKCVGCKKCEKLCCADAIKIAGRGGALDKTKCVDCLECVAKCPVGAISFGGKKAKSANEPPKKEETAPKKEESSATPAAGSLTRRSFIIGSTLASATVAANAAGNEIYDGFLADISSPGVDKRNLSLKPAGSHSLKNFTSKCVGCQLCVKVCPNKVLRPSTRLNDFMQPEMAFDKGFCTLDCTRCSQVCPAGAIEKVIPEHKKDIHIGRAIWHKDRCLAATEGVGCNACTRHCPVGAIELVFSEEVGAKIPVVDEFKCIGCGACEHVCPARPLPGMTIEAFETHREVLPMKDDEVLAEARSLVEKRGYSLAIIKDGIIQEAVRGKGVSPLLKILDTKPELLKDAWVVDRAIGRAAAAICALGGVKKIYTLILSEDAEAFLKERSIAVDSASKVERILNRDKTGLCPMEQACQNLDDPAQMVDAIRKLVVGG